jgi:pyrroline-5-carboxylate reductase
MSISEPIVIIGGGHMGSTLAMRWRQAVASTAGIHVIERNEAARKKFAGTGITVHESLESFNLQRGIVVLAVKPQTFLEIADDVKKYLTKGSVTLVSIMAGVKLSSLEKLTLRCVRLMPNTPAMVGEGMTVACNPRLEPSVRQTISRLFESTGRVVWVEDENLMHAATAVSGSGPAYVFAFMEAFERAARAVGFPQEMARGLVIQTVIGAGQLAKSSDEDPALLRQNVTSPRGTTEAALHTLLKDGIFTQLMIESVKAAHARSLELAAAIPE